MNTALDFVKSEMVSAYYPPPTYYYYNEPTIYQQNFIGCLQPANLDQCYWAVPTLSASLEHNYREPSKLESTPHYAAEAAELTRPVRLVNEEHTNNGNFNLPSKQTKKIKRRSKEKLLKAERNALTNISNQLLTYLYTKKRCNYDLERLFPAITPDDKEGYFMFMRGLKQSMYGYISEEKLLDMWHPE